MILKKGIGISNGIAIGNALVFLRNKVSIKGYKVHDTQLEIDKFHNAISMTSKFLDQLQLLSKTYRDLYETYKLFLTDDAFISKVVSLIEEDKINAEYALKKITDMYIQKLSASDDEYFKAKIYDIKDIYMRLISEMSDTQIENFENATEDSILIFNEFNVADIDNMVKKGIKGFASQTGSKISHKSIIVRESGLVAVSNIVNIGTTIKDGDTVIIDGFLGYLIVNPDAHTLASYKKKKEEYDNYTLSIKNEKDTSCVTQDGKQITLLANINSNDELSHINVFGFHGVGLYRTEFLYIKEGYISEDRHYEILRDAIHSLKDKPLVVRTFDLGGDKISHFMPHSIEENPALGLRAIRYSMRYRDFFASQIRAILRAGVYGDVRLMLPMVSSIEELINARRIIDEESERLFDMNIPFNNNLPIGIMVELPATAYAIDKFSKYADFFSVGSNDLIQYTIGVDRNNDNVNYLFSPVHPGVIGFLKRIHDEIELVKKPLSICGELASDVHYLPLLIGLGYDTLSLNTRSSFIVRKKIASLSVEKCKMLVDVILSCDTASEAENLLTAFNDREIF